MAVGAVEVGEIETVELEGERIELTAVSVGNPHAVVRAPPIGKSCSGSVRKSRQPSASPSEPMSSSSRSTAHTR